MRALKYWFSIVFFVAFPGLSSGQAAPPKTGADPLFLTNGLVAIYPLNGNGLDEGDNQLDGVVTGTSPAPDRFGNPANALHFNGTTDGIDCGNHPEFNFSGSFTIAFWARLDGAQKAKYFLGKYDVPTRGTNSSHSYGVGTAEASQFYGFVGLDGANYRDLRVGLSLGDGKWHALTFIYDWDFGLRMYVDGLPIGSRPSPNLTPFTNSVPFTIGRVASGQGFLGDLDEIRIYNRALSGAEITTLFIHDVDPPIGQIAPAVKVSFTTISGHTYQLESTRDLIEWNPIGVPALVKTNQYTVYQDADQSAKYYRLNFLK